MPRRPHGLQPRDRGVPLVGRLASALPLGQLDRQPAARSVPRALVSRRSRPAGRRPPRRAAAQPSPAPRPAAAAAGRRSPTPRRAPRAPTPRPAPAGSPVRLAAAHGRLRRGQARPRDQPSSRRRRRLRRAAGRPSACDRRSAARWARHSRIAIPVGDVAVDVHKAVWAGPLGHQPVEAEQAAQLGAQPQEVLATGAVAVQRGGEVVDRAAAAAAPKQYQPRCAVS